jgi:Flp pilus assembly protein TadD
MTLGRTEEAIRSYRRAISVHPDNAEAHNMLGVALFRSGDPEAARSHLEEAVRLAPDALEYRTNLEVVRGASGRR